MSQKISAKNLSYNRELPPFLVALRDQISNNSDGPDPILASHRRPVKPRSGSAEAEDAPLVVDDQGNVISGVEIGADGAVKEASRLEDKAGDNIEGKDEVDAEKAEAEKVKAAGIGRGKKSKVGKVVGADSDAEGSERVPRGGESRKPGKIKAEKEVTREKVGEKSGSKNKKKAKKIKLSFGDGEGD